MIVEGIYLRPTNFAANLKQKPKLETNTFVIMKKITCNKMLTASLLSAAMLSVGTNGVRAQQFKNSGVEIPGLHRGVPSLCDFNNDGLTDLYFCGETWMDDVCKKWQIGGWSVQGVVGVNKGDGTFDFKFSNPKSEGWNVTDDEGNVLYTVLPGMTLDDEGNPHFNAYGLPPATWNCTRWIDIDNDGNIDFVTMGEGNDDWQPTKDTNSNRYVLLYRNGGSAYGYTFTPVADSGLLQMANERNGSNAGKSSMSVGDYNNDGYQDIVMQGYYNYMDGDESVGQRVVALFKNNGDGTFTEQNVFKPLPYDQCESPDGIYITDLDNDDNPIHTPTYKMKPMTHGAVIFGDLDNDGYLDIVTTGYGDGNNADGCFYIYHNNGDGTFSQVDTRDMPLVGVYESDLAMADFNGDGWLDILSLGSGRGGDESYGGKIGDIYINKANGEIGFVRSSVADGNGLMGASEPQVTVLDINHDGFFDVVSSGYSGDWRTFIAYGKSDGTFETVTDPNQTGLFHMDSGGYGFGHITSATSLDIVTEYYKDATNTMLMRDSDPESAEAPEGPTEVSAQVTDGKVVVTWPNDDPGLSYNVYFKNTATGWVSSRLAVDLQTGMLRTIQDMQTAIHSDTERAAYSVTLPDGTYEIGVQSIKPDATTSTFTTTTVDVSTAIENLTTSTKDCKVSLVSGGIRVASGDTSPVTVYNTSGVTVAKGMTNTTIPVNVSGVIMVKVGTKITKIIKQLQ